VASADLLGGEERLVNTIANLFLLAGLPVMKHVSVDDFEIDILAIEPGSPRDSVVIVEVKRRPKPKLLKQVFKRLEYADYVYVGVPYTWYAWAYNKLPRSVGVIVVIDNEAAILRSATWVGNGGRLLRKIRSAKQLPMQETP